MTSSTEGEVNTIFHPHKVRTPSNTVVVSGDTGGNLTKQNSENVDPELGGEEATTPPRRARAVRTMIGCKNSCCSVSAKKIYWGAIVTVSVTGTWVGATHFIKYLYIPHTGRSLFFRNMSTIHQHKIMTYNAPFFTTWFCTNWTIFFFPIFLLVQLLKNGCKFPSEAIQESVKSFRDKGLTAASFLVRCTFFCLLWVGTNYMYIHSLKILYATDVMALFATNVACVYLLSWVILHEQFVGVRIFAVILCDTGIALLAYMDGITGSPTVTGVIFAVVAAAGSSIYKVAFKKTFGDANYGQVALFFTLIGLINAALLWPLCVGLYFARIETFQWEELPWIPLIAASSLSLGANLLGNFSVVLTYDLFITLGFITAVPVSAAVDVVLYGAQFYGMKLAGIILISIGFFLVMFPNNWPDYITRLLRNIVLLTHSTRWSRNRGRHGTAHSQRADIDYRTGYIRSHLRSPSGRVR
ncbi:hypothetical protein M8J77_025430 [Diaphorina citri]|nr:hypothetical protein M8J77_025430 [Diaphorina citri]